ncbi:probable LRR receptor-like serine/threonine-protein kinase At3g47570 isoform X1 [Camellia sinensis]|nr:probable LRR receptor-like serine/threonine-protein kinase At3g47570 isoform X1 [Camellia sinensis]
MNFLGSLTNCTNLVGLDLKDNQLRGALQNNVGNLSAQLLYLSLDGNQIYGDIPSTIGYLVNVETLGLAYNQFTGRIPTNVVNLQKLQRLFVSDNKLSGKIPDSIGNLSLLNELSLGNNRLEGTIPSSLGSCQQLLLLELDQNNLNGTIPRQLFDLSTLSISLNLARNHLSGLIPIELGNLKNLAQLDLSENQLSGEIPSSLGSCTSLEYLYLEGNFFQGSIPSSLSSLKGIQNFDFSHNNFSGQNPVYLEYFSLKILNLSFNDFEGEVPTKGVFANASAISITGNKRLCGGISELQLPKCPINESQKKKMSVARLIRLIIITTSATTGVILVTCLIFCWFKKKQRNMPSGSLLRRSLLKVSYGELFKVTDGFSSENLIGAGHFGSVYKGIVDKDASIVAIRVLNLLHREASKSFMAECEALRNIKHRNLVNTITSRSTIDFQGNAFKALVYEFMPNGSLERWLHSCMETDDGQDKIQKLNLLERINIAIDVACALDYLHNHCQKSIVHCDLKPANILLDSDMTAHVGDFGLARFLPQLMNPNESSSMGIRGTVGYAAPEYGLGNEVSTSGDVYSYGILLLEMMTGRRPTDPMFEGGLNLHSFGRIALPDRVLEIVDPTLLNNDDSEAQAEVEEAKSKWDSTQLRNGSTTEECLVSMVKIGVECSMESPQDRTNITNAVHELHFLRGILMQ